MKTQRIAASDPSAVEHAARCLSNGALVAIPTETVYGLAADASNGSAVAGIFEAKGRPRFNPLICHVSDIAMAERLGVFDTAACRLAEHFWPGPLTIVVPARNGNIVHPLVAGGLDTLAIRAPKGISEQIIRNLDRPLAAPSANPSGRVSPTLADHVLQGLDGRIDLVVDGGPCPVGVESTIVKIEPGRIVLLRPGGTDPEAIADLAGLPVVSSAGTAKIEAPGQMRSHYAPHGAVRLNAHFVEEGEALIKFGNVSIPGEERAREVINLSPSGNLREAAARLFAALSQLDRLDVPHIAVSPVPSTGLGLAINDRLDRAAAPRG